MARHLLLGDRGFRRPIASALLAIAVVACSNGTVDAGPGISGPAAAGATATEGEADARANALVVRVIDGDTVEARFEGQEVHVRLIGIDTPESVAPGQPVECYALAASRFTTQRLEGRRVRLELDVERFDQYDRLLAYVWLAGELFNETLVREGYAVVTTYPPNVAYVDRFRAAQRAARSEARGLWGACQP